MQELKTYEFREGCSWEEAVRKFLETLNTVTTPGQLVDITALTTTNTDDCLITAYFSPTIVYTRPVGVKLKAEIYRSPASWKEIEAQTAPMVMKRLLEGTLFKVCSTCAGLASKGNNDGISIVFYW